MITLRLKKYKNLTKEKTCENHPELACNNEWKNYLRIEISNDVTDDKDELTIPSHVYGNTSIHHVIAIEVERYIQSIQEKYNQINIDNILQ